MQAGTARRAVAAAISTASGLGLEVDDAIVLNDSNRLVVRLTPCDSVARITPEAHHVGHHASARRELELVQRLAGTDTPVAPLDPRVEPRAFRRDGFEITLWTWFASEPSRVRRADDDARVLEALHAGLRRVEVTWPHIGDRVAATLRDVANRDLTPDLTDVDRALLADVLRDRWKPIVGRRAEEQLLHGEPHPWNLLDTNDGPLFIDFENTAHGPIEYDLAWAPTEVSEHYHGADRDLVGQCRGIVLAIVATHRWRHDDQHPSGRQSGVAFLDALRAGPPWPSLDEVNW